MSQCPKHDAAFAMAKAILDVVERCIPPGQHQAAFSEFYQAALAALLSYDIQTRREESRLKPSNN
jgi:hypothetical protein